MNSYKKIIIYAGAFLMIYFTGISNLFSNTVKNITATAKYDIPKNILDTFDDGTDPNFWGGNMGIFVSTENIQNSYDSEVFRGDFGYSMKISYDVPNAGEWCGFWIQLAPEGESVDISTYTYFTFWVKGMDDNKRSFKIEIKDSEDNKARLYVSDYLDEKIDSQWRKVSLPLDCLVNVQGLTDIQEIVFVFEHDYLQNSGFPTSGDIFIDDMIFNRDSVDAVRIDHFGDSSGMNALGGNMGSMPDPEKHSDSFSNSVYHSYPFSLKSHYNLDTGEWSGFFSMFGGGDNGWTAVESDFSQYNYLTFWVGHVSGDGNPRVFEIELEDKDSKVKITVPDETLENTEITDGWQKYTIDLNEVDNLDKSTIKQLSVIYDKDSIWWRGGNFQEGILYFDEIQFEK